MVGKMQWKGNIDINIGLVPSNLFECDFFSKGISTQIYFTYI